MFSAELTEGFVTLRVDTAQWDKAVAQNKKEVEALEKSLTPATQMLREAEKRPLSNEMKKANAAWGNLNKGFDKFVKGWDSFNKGLDATTKKLSAVSLPAMGFAAGAVGLGSSASPLAGDTLSKSIQLAGTKIGTTFVPLVMKLAAKAQELGNWWEKLDDTTQKNIGTTAEMTTVSAAAGVGLLALSKVIGVLAKNPLVAVGTAAVGGSYYLAESYRQDREEKNNRISALQRRAMSIDQKEVLADATSRELSSMSPLAAKKESIRQMDLMFAEFERMNDKLKKFQETVGITAAAMPGRNNMEERLIAATGNALSEFEKAKVRANKFAFESKMPNFGMTPEQQKKAEEEKKKGGSGMALGNMLPIQTTFSAPEELWKSIQLAASMSQLDQKILEAQSKANEVALKSFHELEKLNQNLPIR